MGLAVSKHEAFWEACGYGHTDKVKLMIAGGINVDWRGYKNESCAIHVASQGKVDIVNMLIAAKCNVNVIDGRGNLALHHAAMRGHLDIMQALIDAGSSMDIQNEKGWSALLNAAYWCQPEAVDVLLRNKCDLHIQNKDERTALQEACRSPSEDEGGLAALVRSLVAGGAGVDTKTTDDHEADFTPLIFAAFHGHPEVAQVLIGAKCNVDTQTSNKWTALHWAADQGHEDVVRVLLAAGADPLVEGRRCELAVDRAKTDAIRTLLQAATDAARRTGGIEPDAPPGVEAAVGARGGSDGGGMRRSGSKMSSSEFVKFLLSPTEIVRPEAPPVAGDGTGGGDGQIGFMDTDESDDGGDGGAMNGGDDGSSAAGTTTSDDVSARGVHVLDSTTGDVSAAASATTNGSDASSAVDALTDRLTDCATSDAAVVNGAAEDTTGADLQTTSDDLQTTSVDLATSESCGAATTAAGETRGDPTRDAPDLDLLNDPEAEPAKDTDGFAVHATSSTTNLVGETAASGTQADAAAADRNGVQ